MPFAVSSATARGHGVAARRSWLAALAEALLGALSALLLGAAGIDPAAGVRLSDHHSGGCSTRARGSL
jgi:hypothetical protein